jgi:hypothetical protein
MPYPYATKDNVKDRLGITSATKDTLITRMCEEINSWIESVTQRAIGSSSVTNQLISGWEHIQSGGYVIDYPPGLRSIATLEIKLTTDGSYATVPATDYFILPEEPYRTPGWPGFYIHLTDIPSATNERPSIQGAFEAVRLTSTGVGWAAMPGDLRGIAEVGVSRALHSRQAGYADDVGSDEFGEVSVSRVLTQSEKAIVRRYRHHPVEIID